MRWTVELHKILWIANLVLLIILVCLFASFILGKAGSEGLALNSKPEIPETEASFDKEPPFAANPAIILERDIFGLTNADTAKEASGKGKSSVPPSQPIGQQQLQLRLLGTVAGDEEIACAVIEDLRDKIQDLYRVGDIVQGASIEQIEQNRVVLLNQGRSEVLNISLARGTSAPAENVAKAAVAKEPSVADAVKIISPTEREINKKAFLAKVGGMTAVLKAVKISPYVVNGRAEGLRITGLENLSMARFIGLENGDVIQVINGQKVTNKRKAFQVLQKARALSSTDIQLLRGKEKKTLWFGIE